MARTHGRIMAAIWNDGDFIAMRGSAQRMFMFLLSQPDLSMSERDEASVKASVNVSDERAGLSEATWSCPDCAFTFDAAHADPDGGYSCPACGEHAAIARAEAAEARVAAVEAVAAQIEADDEESLNTWGQHLTGSVLVCAEMIRAALTTDQPDPEESR